MTQGRAEATKTPRSSRGVFVNALLILLGIVLFSGFVALGTWQVHRRAWKHDLIARVDARIHGAPVAAPGSDRWSQISSAEDEYRRVTLTGRFQPEKSVRVRASTELGLGSWLLTPLKDAAGTTVLVNRGFVSSGWCGGKAICDPGPPGDTTVTGLLRLSEPKGAFLQDNAPASDHWFSRDVAAIAAARHLGAVAPYFVDADAASSPGRGSGDAGPVGGLTVIAFPDNHLMYAITWYGLALLTVVAAVVVRRHR